MNFINELLFKLKQKLYGPKFWVGPESDIGICDECARENPGPCEIQNKVPVRRLIEDDNIYLCKIHWDSLDESDEYDDEDDEEIERASRKPFIRSVNSL